MLDGRCGGLLRSGGVAGMIIGLMAVEYAVISAWRRRGGRGIAGRDLAPTLLSGGGLALALGFALQDRPPGWIGAALTGALAAHVADLRRRWR